MAALDVAQSVVEVASLGPPPAQKVSQSAAEVAVIEHPLIYVPQSVIEVAVFGVVYPPLSLTGLRVVLRGVKRVRQEAAPELCGCPGLPSVKRAV
jgi:hypothetical protein